MPRKKPAPKSMDVKDILAARHTTHGDFGDVAKFSQEMRGYYRMQPGWRRLSSVQQETIEYIIHKHARIMNGDPNFRDHWVDQVGYLERVIERLPEE